MGDMYREILVKRETTGADKVKKYLAVAVTVLLFGWGVLTAAFPFFIAGLVLALADYYLIIPSIEVEYEYLYVNGDIDIDKILAKSRRKRAASYSKENLEVMAPTGSDHLTDALKNAKVRDFTSRDPEKKTWTLVFAQESGRESVVLELDDETAQDMRRFAPRKVFFD